jgi:UDP-N-acetylmuramate dehydrogenase
VINTGNAMAADIEGLGEEVRRRVYERFGVRLEWEIRRIGQPTPGAAPTMEGELTAAASTG